MVRTAAAKRGREHVCAWQAAGWRVAAGSTWRGSRRRHAARRCTGAVLSCRPTTFITTRPPTHPLQDYVASVDRSWQGARLELIRLGAFQSTAQMVEAFRGFQLAGQGGRDLRKLERTVQQQVGVGWVGVGGGGELGLVCEYGWAWDVWVVACVGGGRGWGLNGVDSSGGHGLSSVSRELAGQAGGTCASWSARSSSMWAGVFLCGPDVNVGLGGWMGGVAPLAPALCTPGDMHHARPITIACAEAAHNHYHTPAFAEARRDVQDCPQWRSHAHITTHTHTY